MNVSVCLSVSVFVCPRLYLRNCTSDLHRNVCTCYLAVARSSSVAVVIRYDVIFAHKPKLLDVADELKRSARAALGLATDCTQ